MEWLETNPIPEACSDCEQNDCYNCDAAGLRWVLAEEDALLVKRKLLVRAAQRLERKIAEIDAQLKSLNE